MPNNRLHHQPLTIAAARTLCAMTSILLFMLYVGVLVICVLLLPVKAVWALCRPLFPSAYTPAVVHQCTKGHFWRLEEEDEKESKKGWTDQKTTTDWKPTVLEDDGGGDGLKQDISVGSAEKSDSSSFLSSSSSSTSLGSGWDSVRSVRVRRVGKYGDVAFGGLGGQDKAENGTSVQGGLSGISRWAMFLRKPGRDVRGVATHRDDGLFWWSGSAFDEVTTIGVMASVLAAHGFDSLTSRRGLAGCKAKRGIWMTAKIEMGDGVVMEVDVGCRKMGRAGWGGKIGTGVARMMGKGKGGRGCVVELRGRVMGGLDVDDVALWVAVEVLGNVQRDFVQVIGEDDDDEVVMYR